VRALLLATGYAVVGEVADGEAALAAVELLCPEIVLLDLQLPGIDGFSVADRLAEREAPPIVVLTSGRDAASYGTRLTTAPASGFIPKRQLSAASLAALVE
jgi:DNA-binding NarL/FixJ family response regulator